MQLKDQVCTESQGKKLEELGIKEKPVFCHAYVCCDPLGEETSRDILPTGFDLADQFKNHATWVSPAFTVAELGVMLPEYVESHKGSMVDTWYCGPIDTENGEYYSVENTEAQARAAYLIYCLENNLVTPDSCNARLKSNL